MTKKLYAFIKKYQDILSYLFFGVLTTAANYLVYIPLYNIAHMSATLSNICAWVVAVVFAFLTNKPFVFKSHDWSRSIVVPEFMKFVGCRIGSGVAETAIIFATVDCLNWNGNITKFATSVLVVILNYVAGRWIVFKK